jgi:glycosidase
MTARLLTASLLFAALTACSKPYDGCEGPDCDIPSYTPWDPGDPDTTGEDDPYGYGPDTDTDTEPEPPREVLAVRSCEAVLKVYEPGSGTVEVGGEFNDWTPAALSAPDKDGFREVSLGELPPGEYAYKVIYDGVWEESPPISSYTKWVDGSENRNFRWGDCHAPLLQTVSASTTAEGSLRAEIQVALAEGEVALDPATLSVTVGGDPVSAELDAKTGALTVDVSGLPKGKHSVRVWVADETGARAENEPLWIPLWVEEEPFQWEDATIYFAFTDRFRNGDWGEGEVYPPVSGVATCANYQGGDFLGIIHAMEEDYLVRLGANTLWLSPIYDNPEGGYIGADGVNWFSGYHGYWPIDPLGIENRLGDVDASGEDRLHELIEAAHAKGIRVLFDLVMNHVHEDHVYTSEHPEWFGGGCVCGTEGCGWEENPIDCWFTSYLPDLNYKNHDVTTRVLDDTMRLIEAFDVDAVRVDAAKHMDHISMRALSMRLRDEVEAGGGAHVYSVGETFTADHALIADYVNEYELDGQFDFPLYFSIRETFVGGGSFNNLEATIAAGESIYGDGLMSPFLGNHDIERFATAVHGQAGDCWTDWLDDPMQAGGASVTEWDTINKASMAFAFVLTQPGVPLIYYGDEIGLAGAGDPDNRRLMNFDPYLSGNQEELLGRVQALGILRQSEVALRRGERKQLWVDDDLYVYARDAGGGEVAVIALNKGGGARTESISLAGLGVDGATLTDATGTRSLVVGGDGSATVTLNSWEYAVFVR